ncbi:hypothetical protein E2C01_012685 [Portunus trituberculatus]|uniref:Uncharacterized protein n=1 Tax=Portunus trituberculatus TaxID=210409 RepID=A0A5B7DEJ1_PORTR|nr:hypothetical protein [Portunus trituberculatus]
MGKTGWVTSRRPRSTNFGTTTSLGSTVNIFPIIKGDEVELLVLSADSRVEARPLNSATFFSSKQYVSNGDRQIRAVFFARRYHTYRRAEHQLAEVALPQPWRPSHSCCRANDNLQNLTNLSTCNLNRSVIAFNHCSLTVGLGVLKEYSRVLVAAVRTSNWKDSLSSVGPSPTVSMRRAST